MSEHGARPRQSRRSVAATRLPVVGGLLLVVLMAAVPALAQVVALTPDAPSPATGRAQVIAQGVAAMPAPVLAWRVVLDTAELPDQATIEERALGFSLADRGAIVIDDEASGAQVRLAGGEAAFVPAGARQRRAALGPANTAYYRIALVPAERAADAGGDRLVLAGDTFAAPPGRAHDLDLVRDILGPNESAGLAAAAAPVLILATVGTVEVAPEGNAPPLRLAAGQATSVAGPVTVTGRAAQPSAFVAAVIGPEVPPPPAPPVGTITIDVLACPADLTPEAAAAAGFAPATMAGCAAQPLDPLPALVLASGELLPPDVPDPAAARYRWTGLLYSPFPFAEPPLPRPYRDWVLVDAAGVPVAASGGSGVQPVGGALVVGDPVPDVTARLFLFARGEGSISLNVFACPAGMTVETLVPASCPPAAADPAVALTEIDTGGILDLAQAIGHTGGERRWENLAFGDYLLTVSTLPPGFDRAGVRGATFDEAVGGYRLTLDETTPAAAVDLFLFPPAATGSLTLRVYDCPPPMTRATMVGDVCPSGDPTSVNLTGEDGLTRGGAEGTIAGNAVTWDGLAAGTYVMSSTGLGAGFADAFVPGAAEIAPGQFATTLAPDAPAEFAIYRFAPADAQPTDSDGDGLADAAEANIGTDPFNPDTDGDGRTDNDETAERAFQTDPLNPDTDGDGVDDGDELLAGTDPTDPSSRPGA